jgi:hypothetical protein
MFCWLGGGCSEFIHLFRSLESLPFKRLFEKYKISLGYFSTGDRLSVSLVTIEPNLNLSIVIFGMTLVVKQNVSNNPLHVGFFCAVGIMFEADYISNLV